MNGQQQCVASHLVSTMIESVCSMWRLKMSPEFVSFFDVTLICMPFTNVRWECSGSVVECLTRDRGAGGSSLTGVTALWSLSKTHLS